MNANPIAVAASPSHRDDGTWVLGDDRGGAILEASVDGPKMQADPAHQQEPALAHG
jgi:hypothetical protein